MLQYCLSCVRYSMLRRRSGARWRPWTARGARWERWLWGIISTSAAASMASPGSSPLPQNSCCSTPSESWIYVLGARSSISVKKAAIRKITDLCPKLKFSINTCGCNSNYHGYIQALLRIRDPVPFWPLDPGYKKTRSGSMMNIPDHISESKETIFWVKHT